MSDEEKWVKAYEKLKKEGMLAPAVDYEELFAKSEFQGKKLFLFSMGTVTFPTGKIIVCDPLVYLDKNTVPYREKVPVGTFMLETLAAEMEAGNFRYIATRIRFAEEEAAYYELALTGTEDLSDWENFDYIGFAVDAGLATVADVKVRDAYCKFESDWYEKNPEGNIYDDFFADIFEYLIKDYNTAGGGKYAEYYTPHAIATIMARLLVGNATDLHSIECYDPSAGTGTLLMALAHKIGEDKCTIFAQDISQRSNKMLKLNLILNSLVSSLDHAIQGDTLIAPYHKSDNGQELRTFDYVVSNPPFKMDFSDTRERIAAMPVRFWAGVPKVPAKKKESMAIYTLFIQHVLNSLKSTGKGAIVVPTGFVTAKSANS